jgi:hypothetical protein
MEKNDKKSNWRPRPGTPPEIQEYLLELAERLPRPGFRRRDLPVLCPLVRPESLANYDSAGTGVEGMFRIGRFVVYPTENFLSWLENKLAPINDLKRHRVTAERFLDGEADASRGQVGGRPAAPGAGHFAKRRNR